MMMMMMMSCSGFDMQGVYKTNALGTWIYFIDHFVHLDAVAQKNAG